MKPRKEDHIIKNRIYKIEDDSSGDTIRVRLKKTVFVLASIAAVSAAIIFIITNLYDRPETFISRIKPDSRDIIEADAKPPDFESTNIHLRKGRESYSRGYINDAISNFNELLESDASNREKAIALTYLGLISNDRSEHSKALQYFQRALNYDRKDSLIYRSIAQTYRKLNEHDRAIEYALRALELKKDDPDTLMLLGNIYYETSQYRQASHHYTEALKTSPGNPGILYNKGITLLQTGNTIDGAEYLKQAAAEDRTGDISHKAYSRLGVLYTEMNRLESAREYLETALSLRPSDAINRFNLGIVYLRQNEKNRALEEFIRAEKLLGVSDPEMLESFGDAYAAAGDYERGISSYQALLERDQRNVRVLSRIAEIYYDQGKLDLAHKAFSRITEIEPATENARIAYLNIGNILDDAGRYEEAAESYERAISLDPNDSNAYYNLGLAYKKSGMPERAVRAWRKGAALNEKDPANAIAIADYYYEQEMYDLAEREYESIIIRWPQKQEPHFKLANINYRRGRPDAALAGFERVIGLNPNSDFTRRALINSAVISMETDTRDEDAHEKSINRIQRALMIKPGDGEALFALATIHYSAGMFDRAIETYLQTIRATADTHLIAEAYNGIGRCYYQKQDYRRALQNFQRAVEENPSKEEYRINRKTASEAYERLISER